MAAVLPLVVGLALGLAVPRDEVDPDEFEVRLGLARLASSKPAQPLFCSGHVANASNPIVTPSKVSFQQFFAGAGKSPVRFVFAADIDGDLDHELVVIREKKKKASRLDLVVVEPPVKASAKKPTTLASLKPGVIGDFVDHGAGAVIAAGAIDVAPALGDELAVVRQFHDGRQALEFFALPKAKQQELSAPVATVPFAGQTGIDAIVDLAPVVGIDGVVRLALRRVSQGIERIDVVPAPTLVGSALAAPVAGYANLHVDATQVRRISALRLGPGEPTALLFERVLASGGTRLEIVAAPLGPDQPLRVFTALELAATGSGDGAQIVAAFSYVHRFTLDEVPPPPPPPPTPIDVDGSYSLYLQYSNPWLCQEFFGCGTPAETAVPPGAAPLMGPLPGFAGASPNGVDFAMTLPAAGFVLDGGMGKPIQPDPYTNLLLKQIGANAKFTATVTGVPGIPDGSLLEFLLLDDDVRISKFGATTVMFAAKAYGSLAAPGATPIPLGYACFVKP